MHLLDTAVAGELQTLHSVQGLCIVPLLVLFLYVRIQACLQSVFDLLLDLLGPADDVYERMNWLLAEQVYCVVSGPDILVVQFYH